MLVISALFALGMPCVADEPGELTDLRKIYFQRLAKVKTPVTYAYIEALGVVQTSLIDSGNVEEAMEVLKTRTALKESMQSGSTSAVVSGGTKADPRGLPQESGIQTQHAKDDSLGGTTWSWLVRNGEIRFDADGSAKVKWKEEEGFVETYSWKQKAPREFLISNAADKAVTYRFLVSDDGKQGKCSEYESNAVAELWRISP